MPCRAARPTPTVTAIGVASPRAQGQAIISTETAAVSACKSRGSEPKIIQATKVTRAKTSTIGTKMAATRSASCWIGA